MRAVLDLVGARLRRRVHRGLDAGGGPVDQAAQSPGVVADMRHDVATLPARQQRRTVETVITERVEVTGQPGLALLDDAQPVVEVEVLETG